MDRQNGEKRYLSISNENWNESCSPIMAMDQFRRWRESSSELDGSLRKKNKSLGVIFVGSAISSINTASIKVFVATNQEYLNLFRAGRLDDVSGRPLSSEINLKFETGRSDIVVTFANGPIERHNDANVVTKSL